MAALISDCDGTVFDWGTHHFLPGVYDRLKKWLADGNQIIFVTRREPDWPEAPALETFLQDAFPGCVVVFGVTSPRILINDEGVGAIKHPKNAPWPYDLETIAAGL